MEVLRIFNDPGKPAKAAVFYCPGCGELHQIPLIGPKVWNWNGSMEKPSFTPSLLIYGHPETENTRRIPRCHTVITDGIINYCGDCEHHLAGKQVPLPENPIDCFDYEFDENGLKKTA